MLVLEIKLAVGYFQLESAFRVGIGRVQTQRVPVGHLDVFSDGQLTLNFV